MPNKDAAIAGLPADANYPDIAKEQGAVGTVQVRVSLDADGSEEDVSIYKSSANQALDDSALDAARRTHFTAETIDCKRQPSSFMFRVDFTGQ